MTKDEIRLSYSKFIGRNYKDYGLVPLNKIPEEYYNLIDKKVV